MKEAEKGTKHLRGELYKANKGQQKLYQENKELREELKKNKKYTEEVCKIGLEAMDKLKAAQSRIEELEKKYKRDIESWEDEEKLWKEMDLDRLSRIEELENLFRLCKKSKSIDELHEMFERIEKALKTKEDE